MLDGQAVTEGDRSAATDYSTRQAAQQALDTAVQESHTSVATTFQRSKASAASQPGLPGSPQRGGPITKGRSTSLKHHKSREVGGATIARQQQSSSVVESDEAIGKLERAAVCEVLLSRNVETALSVLHMQVIMTLTSRACCIHYAL